MSGALVGKVLALPTEAAAGAERMVLVVLAEATNARGDGWCWPSVPAIAADAGLGVRTTRRAIRRVADRKLVEVEERSGKTSRYRVIVPNDDYPFRVNARTNPWRSARGDPGQIGRGVPRSSDPLPRPTGDRGPRPTGGRRTGKNRNEPEAAAKRAFERALKETDRRIAAGERIRNRKKYAESIAADFIDQAEFEVAHTDCPVCRGAGVIEGYSTGGGTYRTPCPGKETGT